MDPIKLPHFPYHRDPVASGSIRESGASCDCCGVARGALYDGNIYMRSPKAKDVCPWCIADGSAATKFRAGFIDGYFCDDDGNIVDVPQDLHDAVFTRTIGFAVFNPVGWWVHCGEPAEYVTRNEPYELVYECRKCHKQHVIEDLD